MCAAAAGGVGSDSEFCRNSNPQGAAVCLGGLAVHGSTGCVFISSCPSSFPPERPAETPQAPGGLPTLVTVPQVCITHVPVRAFSSAPAHEDRNYGQSEPPPPTPFIPTRQRQTREQGPDSELAVCSQGSGCLYAMWACDLGPPWFTAAPVPCSVP